MQKYVSVIDERLLKLEREYADVPDAPPPQQECEHCEKYLHEIARLRLLLQEKELEEVMPRARIDDVLSVLRKIGGK